MTKEVPNHTIACAAVLKAYVRQVFIRKQASPDVIQVGNEAGKT